MEERKLKQVLGASIHDVGKIIRRHYPDSAHSQAGKNWMEQVNIQDKEILDQIRYHHAADLKSAKLDENSLAYITYISDNIASFGDRRDKQTSSSSLMFDEHTPLASIFNLLSKSSIEMYYPGMTLNEKNPIIYPQEQKKEFSKEEYGKIVDDLKNALKGIEVSQAYLDSLFEILEATTSYIPSSTNQQQHVDISLYDHCKLTAAIASCLYDYYYDIPNKKDLVLKCADKVYEDKSLLLVSLDLSGIQSFIYTNNQSNGLKNLRGRSFYLEILMEYFIDRVLNRTGHSRANVLYSGGGHAYLMLANTKENIEGLIEELKDINKWLLLTFRTQLFLSYGFTEFSPSEMDHEGGSYSNIYQRVAKENSKNKSQRYSAEDIKFLNQNFDSNRQRECKVCKRSDMLVGDRCGICQNIIDNSKDIFRQDFFSINSDPTGVEISQNKYIKGMKKQDVIEQMQEGSIDSVYAKNIFHSGTELRKKIWVADYSSAKQMNDLATASTGVKRIGVIRADVDNLGQAFANGFDKEEASFSRSATFSRHMSMYFKYYLNKLLQKGECQIGNQSGSRNATVIYAGGDDLFIIGSWDDIIGFSVDLYHSFEKYTRSALTFSAGIGIYKSKYPIANIAQEVGQLEECAKSVDGKNAICIFDESFVFSWERFIKGVLEEKLAFLKKYFTKGDQNKSTAFLYKLSYLLTNREERLNIARLAYLLARTKDVKDDQQVHKQIYDWAKDANHSHELVLAIQIFQYLYREDKDES